MASILLAYGVVLAGLSFLVQRVAPAFAKVTFIAGISGGGLSLLWSIIALAGYQRRTWAILTTFTVEVVLLTQVVPAWLDTSTSLMGRLVLTLLFLMTVSMLLYLFFDKSPPEKAHGENPFSPDDCSQPPDAGRRR